MDDIYLNYDLYSMDNVSQEDYDRRIEEYKKNGFSDLGECKKMLKGCAING
jgi:hypothetical protein